MKNANTLAPPENSKDLIAQSYMLCTECGDCLIDINKRVYVCRECSPDLNSGNIIYWCQKCKDST